MDTSRQEGNLDSGTGDGKFVYVNSRDGRVRILTQDEEPVLDFLADERIANILARRFNIHGIPKDPNTVRT